jgi:hypothetical protein
MLPIGVGEVSSGSLPGPVVPITIALCTSLPVTVRLHP